MKISVGVTTYNRPHYLARMSASLNASAGMERCSVRVYDDCSQQLDNDLLRERFPGAVEIVRRPSTLGPDFNMHQMYVDFLETRDDYLLAADADLLFHPDWIAFMERALPHTDGVLSLYNSNNHPCSRRVIFDGIALCVKNSLGSAGTVMHRSVIEGIIQDVPSCGGYDWAWCRYLRAKNIRMLVSERSYIQHIGLHGYHFNGAGMIDFGLNFLP